MKIKLFLSFLSICIFSVFIPNIFAADGSNWIVYPLDFAEDVMGESGYYWDPCVYGRYVGFSNYTNGVIYDLVSGNLTELTIFPIDIHGNIVVCQNESSTIAVYNITSQSSYNIGNITRKNRQPSIEGLNVVYTGSENGNNEIFLFNLSSFTEIQITNSSTSETNPDIFGNYMTYMRSESGVWSVCLYNLITETETILDTSSDFRSAPALDGDSVVWVSVVAGTDFLSLYNITSEETSIVVTGDEWFTLGNVSISNNILAWIADYGEMDILYYRDLVSNKGGFLEVSRIVNFNSHCLSDDRIVWTEYGHGTAPRFEFIAFYDLVSNFKVSTDKSVYVEGEVVYVSGGFVFNREVSGLRVMLTYDSHTIFTDLLVVTPGEYVNFSELNGGNPIELDTTDLSGSYQIIATLHIESPINTSLSASSDIFSVFSGGIPPKIVYKGYIVNPDLTLTFEYELTSGEPVLKQWELFSSFFTKDGVVNVSEQYSLNPTQNRLRFNTKYEPWETRSVFITLDMGYTSIMVGDIDYHLRWPPEHDIVGIVKGPVGPPEFPIYENPFGTLGILIALLTAFILIKSRA